MELKKQKRHQSQGDVLLESRSRRLNALLPATRQVTARTLAEILDNAGQGRPAANGDVGSCRAQPGAAVDPGRTWGGCPLGGYAHLAPKRWRHLAIPPGTTPPGAKTNFRDGPLGCAGQQRKR
jgi:hypothetical protein